MNASENKLRPAIVTRGISINEPYAWAVVSGHKAVENRSWPTKFRGPVAIQASTSRRHLTAEVDMFLEDAGPAVWNVLNDERIDDDNPLWHFGAIIGTVDIVGCFAYDEGSRVSFEDQCRAAGYGDWLDARTRPGHPPPGYWAQGGYCLLLANPKQFTVPIPAKGKLNIYNLTPQEIAAVTRALSAPLGSPVEYRAKLAAAGKAGKAAATASRQTNKKQSA